MLRESLPEMEQFLNRSLLNFFEAYSSHGRAINDLLGAWDHQLLPSKAAAIALFQRIKTEPTLLLEAVVEGETFDLYIAYWNGRQSYLRYKIALSFSCLETLYTLVKQRTLAWIKHRNEHIEAGNLAEFEQRYGEATVQHFLNNFQIFWE